MKPARKNLHVIINYDGHSLVDELAGTEMTERDAVEGLIKPLAGSPCTAIDWCILTTAEHNCNLPHGRPFVGVDREIDSAVARVVAHYNAAPLDLLDIVIKHGHLNGLKVYGNIRLNHYGNRARFQACPGRIFRTFSGADRKDFRDDDFHAYLLQLFGDLIEKGVDGISLDFERKVPFFPPDVPLEEKAEACTRFVRKVRALTAKPLIARVNHDVAQGSAHGQDPEAWLREGLVDVIVPATQNHEPDPLDWPVTRFVTAARTSPRPCLVCPQIWPTSEPFAVGFRWHTPEAVYRRVADLTHAGSDGIYFFNFCDRTGFDVLRQVESYRATHEEDETPESESVEPLAPADG